MTKKKKKINWNKVRRIAIIIVVPGIFIAGNVWLATSGKEIVIQAPVIMRDKERVDKEADQSSPTPTPTPEPKAKIKKSWTGVASWYSENGCIGCDPNLIMANGERLDDDRKTIAFNYLPLGTKVRVRNLDNNMITTALVTDTGGFERHGKIADLTLAVMRAINAEGNPRVRIKKI